MRIGLVLAVALFGRLLTVADARVGEPTLLLGTAVFLTAMWSVLNSTRPWPGGRRLVLWLTVVGLGVLAVTRSGSEGGALAASALLGLTAAGLAAPGSGARDWVWWKPVGLVTLGLTVVTGGGILTFIAREYVAYNFRSGFLIPTEIGITVASVLVAVRILLPERCGPGPAGAQDTRIDQRLFRRIWLVVVALSWTGAVAVFARAGVVPLFSSSIDEARVIVTSSRVGMFWPLMQMGMHGVAIAGLAMMGSKKRGRLVLMIVLATIPVSLYGARSMLFLPLATLAVMHAAMGRLKRPAVLGAMAVVLLALGLVFVAYRGFAGARELNFAAKAGLAVSADLFPEMRTAAMVAEQLPQHNEVARAWVSTTLIQLIPSTVLALIGLDKAEMWQPVGRQFLELFARSFEQVPGLRAGFLGEAYIASGPLGVALVALFLLFGARLVARCRSLYVAAGPAYVESWFGLLLAASVLYGNLFLFTVAFVGIPALIIGRRLEQQVQAVSPEVRHP